MNEIILKLYRQAQVPHTAIDPSNNMPYETTTFSAKKFTELIVAECIEQGKQIQSQSVSNGSEEYNTGREMGIEVFLNQIKKHFGVE